MVSTARHEEEMRRKAMQTLSITTDPIEKLRAACLARGAHGIAGLGRLFRIIDDNGNKKLDFNEFKKGINEYGLGFTRDEIADLFHLFDSDRNGSVDFEEFLAKLRPPMRKCRIELVNKAFLKLDKNHDGVITVEDLKGVYNVKCHPKYMNGTWDEDQVLRQFLNVFDTKGSEDGIITREEFLNYYAGVSASIDNDAFFDLMMRTNWKL